MAKKVVASSPNIPHFNAYCHECDWCYQIYDSPKRFDEIRKHVKATGHNVTLERAVFTIYMLDEDAQQGVQSDICPVCGANDWQDVVTPDTLEICNVCGNSR